FRNDWTVDIGFFGLETREPAPPLAAARRVGEGEIIATTLEPWDAQKETHRQLLANLLANAGVDLPLRPADSEVLVKYTPPLNLDGRLDDWISDMDDINISIFTHADPVVMSSADAVQGDPRDDLDYSGIIYLLHDREYLYLGGIIFSSAGPGRLRLEIDGRLLEINPAGKAVMLDNQLLTAARLAVGRQRADEVIDTRLLNLVKINRQIGRPEAFTDTPGVTWEAAIAWPDLGRPCPPTDMAVRMQLVRDDGVILQVPAAAELEKGNICLRFQPDVSVN
ncbi:MAG: hypothetical protein ABR497_09225, partial [Kiritimatiellia bacterium]|nr:hypothetical protein [Lentisphaerota bacterium]